MSTITVANHHYIQPNHQVWGMGAGRDNLTVDAAFAPEVQFQLEEKSRQLMPLDDFTLVNCMQVNNSGDKNSMRTVLWLRWQKTAVMTLQHDHAALLFDAQTHQLLSFTRMLGQSRLTLLSHQRALETACAFLSKHAPHYMNNPQVITLPKCQPEQRLCFTPGLVIGKLQLHWIDHHSETIGGKIITGMKVKFYQPSNDSWLWVIVNQQQQVITFESDVYWDRQRGVRLTPMWLHDQWIIENELVVN